MGIMAVQQLKDTVSSLREILEDAIAEHGGSMKDFTVLSAQNDPFRLVKPENEGQGRWFADWYARLPKRGRGHLRDCHYSITSGFENPTRHDGKPYVNDDAGWTYLLESSTIARFAGLVDFDAFEDKKSQPPIIKVFKEPDRQPWLDIGLDIEIPDVEDIHPEIGADFTGIQPYRIILFGEKAGLEADLRPIAERYGGALFLCEGEIGYGPVYQMAKLGLTEHRPIVVLTFTDCDPAGWQMPISISRKLQAFQALNPSLSFKVYRIALTADQVREYNLPTAPLKETEKRAAKWKALMGVEQTEINALYVTNPQVLQRLARRAIAPFFDSTLSRRSAEAAAEWQGKAQAIIDAKLDQEQLERIRAEAAEKFEAIRAEVERLRSALRVDVQLDELPEIKVPQAELQGDQPMPLIDSEWGFAMGSQRLIDSKGYGA